MARWPSTGFFCSIHFWTPYRTVLLHNNGPCKKKSASLHCSSINNASTLFFLLFIVIAQHGFLLSHAHCVCNICWSCIKTTWTASTMCFPSSYHIQCRYTLTITSSRCILHFTSSFSSRALFVCISYSFSFSSLEDVCVYNFQPDIDTRCLFLATIKRSSRSHCTALFVLQLIRNQLAWIGLSLVF